MLSLETLREDDLRGPLSAKSLRRARGYVDRVQSPVRVGETLAAQVRGTRQYKVEVKVEAGCIEAACTCPYDWGGFCKHIGAVLLKWISAPEEFAPKTAVPFSKGIDIEVVAVDPPTTYRPEELPQWISESWDQRPQTFQEELETWLSQIKLQDLRQMARNRGWRLKGTRKADIVHQIIDFLVDPEDIARAVQGLDGEHRLVLRAMLLLGGGSTGQAGDLETIAGAWGALGSHERASTYARHLWKTGLALPGFARDNYSYKKDFIPFALARHFPPLLEEMTTDIPADAAASGLNLADPYALVRTANQIALLLEQAPVPLRPPMPRPGRERLYPEIEGWDYDPAELAQARKRGSISHYRDLALTIPTPPHSLPDEAMERLAPLAGGKARLEFIFSLLVETGVLQPGSPTTAWSEVKTQFLRRDELGQRTLLARSYLRTRNWSALWEVLRTIKSLRLVRSSGVHYYKPANLKQDLVELRHFVLRTLASLPDREWVTLENLFQLLRTTWARFDQTVLDPYYNRYSSHQRHRAGAWFLARGERPLRPGDRKDWDLAQGNFVRQIISGPLYWLGLADLCLEGKDLAAFRLQGLNELYWDRCESVPPPGHITEQALSITQAEAVETDGFEIIVRPSAVKAQAHNLLDKIARLDVAEPDRFVYHLSAQAAYEAFEGGAALSEVQDDWEQFLRVPMPVAIRSQLAAWWQAYGQVRLYTGLTVIEFGDDYALAEAKAVTSLDKYLIAEVSPRLAIISPQAIAPLRAEFEKAGYTPKLTEEV